MPADVIDAVNIIAAWLAIDDYSSRRDELIADAIVLTGNAVLTTIDGACSLAKTRGIPLIISGGIGHSTGLLAAAIEKHPRYRDIDTSDTRPEACLFHDIAARFWDLPDEQILLESASRNTGENAKFTRDLLEKIQFEPRNIVLIQDPLLQRRAYATFCHTWSDSVNRPAFFNWPTYIPRLIDSADGVRFSGDGNGGLWDIDRFISLLLGEIPRLRDNEQGYGPRGKNYICHVDIPKPIEDAWRYIMRHPRFLTGEWREHANIMPS
ncbi:YdcF family protein [Brenneria izadpanahii]|uniref:YdcF family protein n=2 Tax=Brenneria izadpanahii TaxID=2722756 RepID=A0ABX7UY92_9GAMM|nr:YdcF family protein [Brenneria izadpanahii]